MEISSVRIKRNNNHNDALLGVASVEFDNCFIIHDIKLIQLKDKRIISFPNKKVKKYTVKDGEYKENFEFSDIAHPSNKDFREYIETELFKIYDNEIEGGNKENE